jgi:hypothetical protein
MKIELSYREALQIVIDELCSRGALPHNTTIATTVRLRDRNDPASWSFGFEPEASA